MASHTELNILRTHSTPNGKNPAAMNIEDARIYCLSKPNATEDFPFDETTLVFRVENKIFAITDLENTINNQ